MFPLEFPRRVLRRARPGEIVVDPFCGRGTTLYAAREAGLECHGTDVSRVAVAISRAKLAEATPEAVLETYDRLMEKADPQCVTPDSAFWQTAYHKKTLRTLCQLRQILLKESSSEESSAVSLLRALALGALHGPLNKGSTPSSYFSNQMMRTFAPKPDYAVRFWESRQMEVAPQSNVRDVLEKRANRLLRRMPERIERASVRNQDARRLSIPRLSRVGADWIITSPPYYGMRTYEQDQWLRHWFVGGPDLPDYSSGTALQHSSPDTFAAELALVWDKLGRYAHKRTKLVVRFGAIGSRSVDYDEILKKSLCKAKMNWRLITSLKAGQASDGRRQSVAMGKFGDSKSVTERDYYIRLVA